MKNYTITVNGNVYEVSVEEGATGVASAPTTQPAKVAPKAPVAAKTPVASGASGNVKVNSPMPGKILALKANVGESVKKGQVLLVLEAMKMENEIVAPSDGTVASVNVAVGSSVEAGELLASLN